MRSEADRVNAINAAAEAEKQKLIEEKMESARKKTESGIFFTQLSLALISFAMFMMAYRNNAARSRIDFDQSKKRQNLIKTSVLVFLALALAVFAGFFLPDLIRP